MKQSSQSRGWKFVSSVVFISFLILFLGSVSLVQAGVYFSENLEDTPLGDLTSSSVTHNGGTWEIVAPTSTAARIIADPTGMGHGNILEYDDDSSASSGGYLEVWAKMDQARNENLTWSYDLFVVSDSTNFTQTCRTINGTTQVFLQSWYPYDGHIINYSPPTPGYQTIGGANTFAKGQWYHVVYTLRPVGTPRPLWAYYDIIVTKESDGSVILNQLNLQGRMSLASGQDFYKFGIGGPSSSERPHLYLDNIQISNPAAADPTLSPQGGTYTTPQSVTISCATVGATIRYTTDGSDPTETNGETYDGTPVTVDRTMTIKARAFATGLEPSAIKAVTYSIAALTPVVDPLDYILSAPRNITITSVTSGATIRYTTDGSDPTETNGTAIANGGSVMVDHALTLKARAFATGLSPSGIKTVVYSFPASYDRPDSIAHVNTVTIDGNFAEWNSTDWVPLDQVYGGNPSDVVEAYYAVKWNAVNNKIYVAVKVLDTAPAFTDSYDNWDSRDAIEIYIHSTGNGPINYIVSETDAQQYAVGITNSDHNTVWSVVGGGKPIPAGAGFQAAGKEVVSGSDHWLHYEAALTPFHFFALDGTGLIPTIMQVNDIIGFDVVVIGNTSGGVRSAYTGMKSENMLQWKSADYNKFGLHKLAAAAPALHAGDANGDGMVDVGDLGILAANYGGSGKTWAQGDFNDDGMVDVGDLGILAANYGFGAEAAMDFNADYAKAFGTAAEKDDAASSSLCSGLGLPLVIGLLLAGLMLVRLEE